MTVVLWVDVNWVFSLAPLWNQWPLFISNNGAYYCVMCNIIYIYILWCYTTQAGLCMHMWGWTHTHTHGQPTTHLQIQRTNCKVYSLTYKLAGEHLSSVYIKSFTRVVEPSHKISLRYPPQTAAWTPSIATLTHSSWEVLLQTPHHDSC